MFSIVIPVFNKQNVLPTTLDSVLKQKEENFEVIIIDDGSSDNSLSVLQPFLNDHRFRVIEQKNMGVAVARNRGVQEASHDWVAFLDADDWWHPDYLSSLRNMIELDPKCEFAATSFFSKPDSFNWEPQAWQLKGEGDMEVIKDLPSRWMMGIPFFTSSICLSRRLLNKQDTLFKEGESNGEDLDLWFRLAEQVSIRLLKSSLVVYRADQKSSLTSEHDKLEDPYHLKNIKKRLRNLQIPKTFKKSYKNFIGQHYLSQSRVYLVKGERVSAFLFCIYGFHSIKTKRWWMTLFMCLFLSKRFVEKWVMNNSGRQEYEVEK